MDFLAGDAHAGIHGTPSKPKESVRHVAPGGTILIAQAVVDPLNTRAGIQQLLKKKSLYP